MSMRGMTSSSISALGSYGVQCKSAVRKGDVVAVSTRGNWYSPSRGYVRTSYASHEVDAIAAYCSEIDATFLLPISLVDGQSQVHLRLAPARNGQLAGLHSASEYELGAIAQLGERRDGIAEAVGSSPTSSTSGGAGGPTGLKPTLAFLRGRAAGSRYRDLNRTRPRCQSRACFTVATLATDSAMRSAAASSSSPSWLRRRHVQKSSASRMSARCLCARRPRERKPRARASVS
jgi:hypothetical protein